MAFGRPSKYDPDFCEQVIELGRQGKSKTYMAGALGVNKDTLYEWEKQHKDFSDALTHAMVLSQQWWEDAGQSGLFLDKFNAAVYNKQMAVRFPDEHREVTKTELKAEITARNITDVSDEQLAIVATTGSAGTAE